MIVYCVTKNTGPSWQSDPLHLVYLGTSIEDAEKSVGDFTKYQQPESKFPVNFLEVYSVIPKILNWELIQYYAADGWWYSIVMFELKEET